MYPKHFTMNFDNYSELFNIHDIKEDRIINGEFILKTLKFFEDITHPGDNSELLPVYFSKMSIMYKIAFQIWMSSKPLNK